MKPSLQIPNIVTFFIIILTTTGPSIVSSEKKDFEFEEYGVKYANPCEVCKITVIELEEKLFQTGKNGEILQTSYHIDARSNHEIKKKAYKRSQVRLIESMETTCEGILTYSLHKERTDSTRFAKGQSQTFSTLHGLVAKGVKVDLGIPFEMWDKPSAEITDLKSKCENLMEKYETEIEDWYNQGEETRLMDYLCRDTVLKTQDASCLNEKLPDDAEISKDLKMDKSKARGEL